MKQNKKGQHKEAWKSRNNSNIELFFTSMEQHKHQEGEINRNTTSNEIKKEKSSTTQHQEGEINQRKKKDVIHGRALRRREEVRGAAEVVVDERGDRMRQESCSLCFWRVMEVTGRKGENRAGKGKGKRASAVVSSSSPAKEVVDWRIRVELRVLRMI
ncbi:hypothetical protein E3N88_45117 [Mikania micrantha]|uniref:Uncharacterized protein n=1 Tax=Mikania micrantha TaxID=192012 RepID=A0A5N6LA11_9ASTR|nr:hypothetical protein E3N88_45117 [Mikania micrantha]